jgi:carbon storage regulator
MLVLSRQRDETIMIGDDIEITIVDIRGDKVRLGITAPATIPVHRKEVYEAIQRENREAAKVKMEDLPNMPTPPHKGGPKGPGTPGNPAQQRPQVPFTRPPNTGGTPPGGNRPPQTPPQSPPPAPPSGSPSKGPEPKGPVGSL